MENELLKIFDENGLVLGTATRAEAHRKGLWHETFHFWLVGCENGKRQIYFQIRSPHKKDFPNKLDITAAGHLLAHETVMDGIREVKEELGLDIPFGNLHPAGTIPNVTKMEGFIDREFCHVFFHHTTDILQEFQLQKEEVAGIVKADAEVFAAFCEGKVDAVRVKGYTIGEDGQQHLFEKNAKINDFAPHQPGYFKKVATAAQAL
ncbi:NUDIX hydrolase [Heyndrickxia acidiproducens]|uniref:NUDIX hydrolase n=1 Tax=Heyndrickxia acidiproducens TaxID=1121084 RepID=UPI000363C04B|nr:NUDIX domain-containing protein [Heyndrickxia acidiproducens]